MSLDIHTAVQTGIVISLLAVIFSLWIGYRSIRKAQTLKFFRMRRDRMVRGWRLVFFGFAMGFLAIFMNFFAEPLAYRVFPPTPTLTNTPTARLPLPSPSPPPSH
jgi:membrane protease YdiL (CAAX protease family)